MATKKFAMLYKKSSTGKIQQWQIAVEGATIVTTYGQVGGKLQTTKDLVKSGKNQGRKNETGPEDQALKEAESKFLKQKKAGYTKSLKDAESGKTDSVIEGGIVPMLAKNYDDHKEKLVYPVAVQPKLDGIRCVAIISDEGEVSLWTRTRKSIKSVPHIVKALEELYMNDGIIGVLDGELYNHDLKNDFEKIVSAVRKDKPSKESEMVEYHVYDLVSGQCFLDRFCDLQFPEKSPIKLVRTDIMDSESECLDMYSKHVAAGYEGAMIRSLGIKYENKRSSQLLKMKGFIDCEYKIVGMEEGRGKLSGHLGAFICELTKNGARFKAKPAGKTENLKEYWENKSEYIGQMLTVKYQNLTADGLPRFPVGMRIREDL